MVLHQHQIKLKGDGMMSEAVRGAFLKLFYSLYCVKVHSAALECDPG